LEVTPRECFEEGAVWARSNADAVRLLREAPDRIAADEYAIGEARSWLARALGIGKRRRAAEGDLAELERALPAASAQAGVGAEGRGQATRSPKCRAAERGPGEGREARGDPRARRGEPRGLSEHEALGQGRRDRRRGPPLHGPRRLATGSAAPRVRPPRVD